MPQDYDIAGNINGFRNESKLSTWIYKIAYNEALMVLRKKSRQSRLDTNINYQIKNLRPGLFVNWPKVPDQQLLEDEFKERLENSIKAMPIKYRMPLLLENVEELPQKTSAQILSIKTGTFKTRLRRARIIIKDQIKDYLKDRLPKKEEYTTEKARRCGIATRFVYDYAQGSLDEAKKAGFDAHINDCPGCKAFLNAYTKAIEVTKALECNDLPEELQAKIETFLSPLYLNK